MPSSPNSMSDPDATGDPEHAALVNRSTVLGLAAVPLMRGELSFAGEPGTVSTSSGGAGGEAPTSKLACSVSELVAESKPRTSNVCGPFESGLGGVCELP